MNSKKHIINEEPEECVQVVFTNLIKKSRTIDSKVHAMSYNKPNQVCNQVDKFELTGVIVNGKVYHFNLKSLIEKEPTNNLLNIHIGEIKKGVNKENHTIEYIEQIPDFNLVIDYINGYSYKNFDKVFNNDYARFESFRLLLAKLGMPNLILKLDSLYPLLNINGIIHNVSIEFINILEPSNKLFCDSRRLSNNTYIHFRDREIFIEYFRDYLLGKKTLTEAADYINKLKKMELLNIEDYILAKIENDLYYYGLYKLRLQVFESRK
jgi:hypothetical protein